MNSATIRNWAAIVALVSVSLLCLVTAAQVQRLSAALQATNAELLAAAGALKRASTLTANYLDKQTALLGDARNQKALEAGWQTPAVLNGLVKLVIKTTVPELNHNLRILRAQTEAVGRSSTALFEQHTLLAASLGTESRAVLQNAAGAIDEVRQLEAQFGKLLASSRYLEIEAKILSVIEHADLTAAEIERAAKEIAILTDRGGPIADEIKTVLTQAAATLKAGEGTLKQGTQTLGTLRKVSIAQVLLNALFGVAKWGFE